MELSSPLLMEPHGLQGLRGHQIILIVLSTQTVPSWVWGENGRILTSSDGTTWTSRTSGITNHLWESPTGTAHS